MTASKSHGAYDTPLQNLSPTFAKDRRKSLALWQELPATALGRSGVSQKAAALAIGKSESWLSRALKGVEKLGWRDLGAIDDQAFWGELLELMAAFHEVAFAENERARKDAEIGRRIREALEMSAGR